MPKYWVEYKNENLHNDLINEFLDYCINKLNVKSPGLNWESPQIFSAASSRAGEDVSPAQRPGVGAG
jgi:hypothetical protein